MREHRYSITVHWTGNLGTGTSGYRAYSRNHELIADGKPGPIACSSDPTFRGDRTRYSPEELLVGSLSACHMLWMLHLCADAGIVVTEYSDAASGSMIEHEDGSGEFREVTLRPRMRISDPSHAEQVRALHHKARELCFIARSVNFPVRHEPEILVC